MTTGDGGEVVSFDLALDHAFDPEAGADGHEDRDGCMAQFSPAERLYVDAVGVLVAAEAAEAEAFLVRKHEVKPPRSDWEARAMALDDTENRVTLAKGALEIARHRMDREAPDADQR